MQTAQKSMSMGCLWMMGELNSGKSQSNKYISQTNTTSCTYFSKSFLTAVNRCCWQSQLQFGSHYQWQILFTYKHGVSGSIKLVKQTRIGDINAPIPFPSIDHMIKTFLFALAAIATAGKVTNNECKSVQDCPLVEGLKATCYQERCFNSLARWEDLCGKSTPNNVKCEDYLKCDNRSDKNKYTCRYFFRYESK